MAVTLCALLGGCGTTQQKLATQQLLESDAVDAAIAAIDFRSMRGQTVYFDDTYLKDYKGVGFVNANYVVSGLRQQILAAGCLLQDKREEAEVVIEGRIGALGTDAHDVVYGIPKNNALSGVASAVPGSPNLPAVPELAIAKKAASFGAAKLALFAYNRETREPVWQSGLAIARSTARDTWILGAGPFQDGTIHRDRVRFAGTRFRWRFWKGETDPRNEGAFQSYSRPAVYAPLGPAPLAETPQLAEAQPPATSDPHPETPPAPAPGLLATETPARPIAAPNQPVIQQVSAETPADPTADPPAATPQATPAETPPAATPQTSPAEAPPTETPPAAAAAPAPPSEHQPTPPPAAPPGQSPPSSGPPPFPDVAP